MGKVKLEVLLDNVELSKSELAALKKEINNIVASKLMQAKIAASVRPGLPALAYKIPKDWMGIWIKGLKLPTDLKKFGGKDLTKFPGLQ